MRWLKRKRLKQFEYWLLRRKHFDTKEELLEYLDNL